MNRVQFQEAVASCQRVLMSGLSKKVIGKLYTSIMLTGNVLILAKSIRQTPKYTSSGAIGSSRR